MDKIKKFEEFKLNEGMRFNSVLLSLDSGEHPIEYLIFEVRKLLSDLEDWRDMDVKSVTAVDNEHKEIIPYWK